MQSEWAVWSSRSGHITDCIQKASASRKMPSRRLISQMFDFNAPDTYYMPLEQNRFAEYIRRPEKQLATANLAWYRARVGWFVDAPSLVVCATAAAAVAPRRVGSRAQVEHNFLAPSFNYFQFLRLPSLSNWAVNILRYWVITIVEFQHCEILEYTWKTDASENSRYVLIRFLCAYEAHFTILHRNIDILISTVIINYINLNLLLGKIKKTEKLGNSREFIFYHRRYGFL